MTVTATRGSVRERLQTSIAADRAAAWVCYLEATRGQISWRYDEVEPWAWGQLQATLRALHAREMRLQ